ncbi:hypothetical protein HW115_09845 [Verrucomicrobiaceae bacterium N1E253]|uniref:Uncharacterized protein n=1 Tax=Oceaniferula marina TaxID=2748318 RepID=A0A851GP45_9BACT|nr:hypothetical protein [Oceaniferula marina]NWK55914.1 hypothetical protein [Oceaniferula marina]
MKRRTILYSLLSLLAISTCAYALEGKVSGKKGWVKSPGSTSHLVACKPGERFTVTVSSDKKTNVSIVYTTLAQGRRAENLKSSSKNKTRHTLSFTAPTSKPSNNMKYWNYKISVSPGSSILQTNYTISIR